MALITCPDCQRQISDAAPACLGCGRPMRTSTPSSIGQRGPIEVRDRDHRNAVQQQQIATVVLIVGVVCAILGANGVNDIKWFDGILEYGGYGAMVLGFIWFLVGRSQV